MEMTLYFQVFQDANKHWRWRLKAANHAIIATSGEGYVNNADCKYAISLVKQAGNAPVNDV
jgi:uncharacterized protein YegP (UPF0339 family)